MRAGDAAGASEAAGAPAGAGGRSGAGEAWAAGAGEAAGAPAAAPANVDSGLPTAVDPPDLYTSPAFAQGMIAPAGRTLYVGGQNGTDATGALFDGLKDQTEQALRNVLSVLAAAESGPEYVVKLTIHLAAGIDPTEAYAATGSVWGNHRTSVTVLTVTPARPGALVEIDAVATIPTP